MKQLLVLMFCAVPMMFAGCKKDDSNNNSGGGGINLFTIQDDKELGAQVNQEILSDPAQFPVLDPVANAAAYAYLDGIKNDILNSGQVRYAGEFAWEVRIIDQDDIQNAFCTPGGYIYVYTGLIKYLDSKSSLAGVMGHEIAHADKRHSTEQLTKAYGLQTLLDIVLGENQGLISDVAAQLVTLEFSRDNERESDMASVDYLCPTKYRADGAADFFQKIIDAGTATPPQFLSTHPNPDNRVQSIKSYAQDKNCTPSISQDEEIAGYNAFRASL